MPDEPQLTIKQQRDLKQEEKERRRAMAAKQGRMKNIITWSIVGLVVAGIVALIVASGGGQGSTNAAVATVDQSVDHVQGSTTAKAVLIEYSDFQCPACGAYYPIVKNLQKKYGDQVTLVYRNYPLTQLHQYAQLAAQAAEAANLQGKYWEMHDVLFEHQGVWPTDKDVTATFKGYAKDLKLDEKKFATDLTSSAVKDRVQRDIDSGNAVAINATPTFYLNGTKLTTPGDQPSFEKVIDAALAKK